MWEMAIPFETVQPDENELSGPQGRADLKKHWEVILLAVFVTRMDPLAAKQLR